MRLNRFLPRLCRIWSVGALMLAGLLVSNHPAYSRTLEDKLEKADFQFEEAEMARASLDELPADQRSLKAYTKVVQSYRRIYFGVPNSSKATVSLMRIADLYQAMANDLKDDAYLQSAVKTYDFLLKEYPYSQNRSQALLISAQILQNSLNQPEEARKRVEALRKRYPRSEEAKASLELLAQSGKATRTSSSPEPNAGSVAALESGTQPSELPPTVPSKSATKESSGPVEVSNIREWKTPTSTRIVIDLGSEVKYEIGTADSPRRVYLDLYGTKISRAVIASLAHRSVDNAAAIKAIRAAQNQASVTRVVAEIDAQSEYSVFDLTNPYRLIIDLKSPRAAVAKDKAEEESSTSSKAGTAAASPSATIPAIEAKPTSEKQQVVAKGKAEPSASPSASIDPKPVASPPVSIPVIIKPPIRATGSPSIVASNTHGNQSPEKAAVESKGVTANPGTKPAAVAEIKAPVIAPPVSPSIATPVTLSPTSTAAIPPPPAVVVDRKRPDPQPSPVMTAKTENVAPIPSAAPASPIISPVVPETKKAEKAVAIQPAPPPQAETASLTPNPQPSESKNKPAAIKIDPAVSKPVPAATTGISDPEEQYKAALPARDGTRSLTRALGLKIGRIILDAGHGGHDKGTVGPSGLMEKDLVLDVTKRLGKLLSDRLGSEVVYTRENDTFVPLETRTEIANEKQADLFLSIHANSSPVKSAKGIETYYLSFASDPAALEVASRENALAKESVHDLQDIVKQIALHDKVDESKEFASEVQNALYTKLNTDARRRKDRGVKKAPFVVLLGARMPSVLAEIAFLSNPQEEKLLRTKAHRQKIAEALYSGIAKYVNSLSGLKVAKAAEIAKTSSKLEIQ